MNANKNINVSIDKDLQQRNSYNQPIIEAMFQMVINFFVHKPIFVEHLQRYLVSPRRA